MSDATDGRGLRVRWDRSASGDVASTIASATTASGDVIINFGARSAAGRPGEEEGVILIRRIALRPVAAKRLHDMLSRLLAEAGANISASG